MPHQLARLIAVSTSLGACNRLLVTNRLGLEWTRELDVVMFDKTGTLTKGQPMLFHAAVAVGKSANEVLRLGAAADAKGCLTGAWARRNVLTSRSVPRAACNRRYIYGSGPLVVTG